MQLYLNRCFDQVQWEFLLLFLNIQITRQEKYPASDDNCSGNSYQLKIYAVICMFKTDCSAIDNRKYVSIFSMKYLAIKIICTNN